MQKRWSGLQDIFCFNAITRDGAAKQTKLWQNVWLVCRFATLWLRLDGGFAVLADQNACAVENGLLKNAKIGEKMLTEVLCGRLNPRLVGVWSACEVENKAFYLIQTNKRQTKS